MSKIKRCTRNGTEYVETSLKGIEVLNDPLLNKGIGFTEEERRELHLLGLLPCEVSTIEDQAKRRYENFMEACSDLSKYIFLNALQDRNEVLYYHLVLKHIEEMMPYIYTPTVGDVSLRYSYLYTQHRGTYFSYPFKEQINEIVNNIPKEMIDVIVITDGERILGLGDVGVGGMAIPVGKLNLYTLFGGIHPSRIHPVFIDVGTDNEKLLSDPLYIGWRHPRIRGEEYFIFIDQIVKAIKKRFPQVLLQWEDFAKQNARPLLEKYRHEILSFNDDIQGTAAVTLAAILAGLEATSRKLIEQNICIFGGGSAGQGIAEMLIEAMKNEGMSQEEAEKHLFIIDVGGLTKKVDWPLKGTPQLKEVIQYAKPSILIGTSAQKGAFTEEIVTLMSSLVKRPIILPLSNPTSHAEACPEDLFKWSQGEAIVATGSPFPPVNGRLVAQCNNVYIFPGMGLGAITGKLKEIPNHLFPIAAKVLASYSPMKKDRDGLLFPPLTDLRKISREIAVTVLKAATGNDLSKEIDEAIWTPVYAKFSKAAS
ncbi:MAG: NAD-dependent malic enzyme [Simkaniaceae bacterium]|nr:NAD-dependent malic enzyme [Simkaniaceae bacterium]